MENILGNMSQQARDATLYELITRGKYGNSGHGLNPKEIANSFHTHLKSNVRESIENTNPEVSHYLENLKPMLDENSQISSNLEDLNKNKEKLEKETQGNIAEGEKQRTKAEEGKQKTEQEQKQSNISFAKELTERFGLPKAKTTGIYENFKKLFSPLSTISIGTAALTLHSLGAAKMAEILGVSIPIAKKINELLTDPNLLKHYVEGTKVKPNLKGKGTLEENIRKGLSYPKNIPNNNKPLELEVIGKRRK